VPVSFQKMFFRLRRVSYQRMLLFEPFSKKDALKIHGGIYGISEYE